MLMEIRAPATTFYNTNPKKVWVRHSVYHDAVPQYTNTAGASAHFVLEFQQTLHSYLKHLRQGHLLLQMKNLVELNHN
jgi:hypothetical protein